jgi:hypothetical protein
MARSIGISNTKSLLYRASIPCNFISVIAMIRFNIGKPINLLTVGGELEPANGPYYRLMRS